VTQAMSLTTSDAGHESRDIPAKHTGVLAPNYYCRAWNAKRIKYCRARAGLGTDHPGVGRCKHHGGNAPIAGGLRRRYELRSSPRLNELIEQYQNDPEPLNVLSELAAARALMHDWLDRYSFFVGALTAWYDTWEGRYMPLSDDEKAALTRSLDEYEALLTEGSESGEPTEEQLGQLALSRSAIVFLTTEQQPKPRQILDVSDAMRHVDVISKVITRAETIRAQGTVSIDRLRMFLLALDRGLEIEVADIDLRTRLRRMIHAIRV
jgi:hypothetical protein